MDINNIVNSMMMPEKVNTEVQIAVLKKNMDTTEQAGEGLIKMMEQSVVPNVGKNVDIRL